ncbi:MAG: hypothetical protein WC718_11880 [Phycisphaerales bacterium]|jgi:hypothetical protein
MKSASSRWTILTSCAGIVLAAGSALAQAGSPAAAAPEWQAAEAPLLTHHVQLTSRDQFVKAGEAYFSPDGEWIIFQAIAVPKAGEEADPFYAMYVGRLVRDAAGHVTGLRGIGRISPDHSANTCGWFDPKDPSRVIFGSTVVHPTDEKSSGFQVGSRRYVWQFPSEMDVVSSYPFAMLDPGERGVVRSDIAVERLISRPNYDAECSFSGDGRYILYGHVEDRPKDLAPDAAYRPDANIYIRDTKTGKDLPVVSAPGYDGGPFFSPDGTRICYRSDRKGDDLLQLYIAELAHDNDGVPTGIAREYQLTDNGAVNWAPFWHPNGKFLVYASSEIGHQNYEVFAVELDAAAMAGAAKGVAPGTTVNATSARRARITNAAGADVLPTFSNDGKLFMWTCQRGPMAEGEAKPSSQIWIAEWNGEPEFKDAPAATKP